jgi:peroxiredoxin Q/BCP
MARRLSVGDRIPQFELSSQHGDVVRSDDLLGKGPLVIYFYPRDHTPGCTTEACAFRDSYEDLKEAGAEVVGISADSQDMHQGFAAKHNLPFILLADENNLVRGQFGVRKHAGLIPGRETFILDKNGVIVHHFRSLLNAIGHVQGAVRVVKDLVAAG